MIGRSDRHVIVYGLMVSALLAVGGLIGCQLQQQGAIRREDELSAAGFLVRIANTAQRQAMLNRLPPNRFVQRVNGHTIHYIYADPVVCGCLYIGSQEAFDRYRSTQQLDIAGARKMAVQSYYDAAWNWDAWGPWGPLGPIYGPGLGW